MLRPIRSTFALAVALGICWAAVVPAGATPQPYQGDPALRPIVTGIPRLPLQMPVARQTAGSLNLIQHVVIIVQENRSFDDLFQGYPGANTQSYGYDSSGNKVVL